eukprot:5790019-Pleurochrysis_carterae.AAC.1
MGMQCGAHIAETVALHTALRRMRAAFVWLGVYVYARSTVSPFAQWLIGDTRHERVSTSKADCIG